MYKGKQLWVCMIDGVMVGWPCCAIHNCKTPLKNNQHCFCPHHSAHDNVCSIVGCSTPTAADSQMSPEAFSSSCCDDMSSSHVFGRSSSNDVHISSRQPHDTDLPTRL
ncbi:hypothetical protein L208DRAFT_1328342 [Tricholoma matsutake]|nr:hypothetical protein L208DRAFT_1328342 [Tricholoma matsutake 945]